VCAVVAVEHATVQDWYATYNARDLDAMCGLADPEIVVAPHRPLLRKLPGATFHGHIGLRTLMQWAFETYPRARITANTVRDVSGVVLATTTFLVEDGEDGVVETETYTLFDGSGNGIRRVDPFAGEAEALAAASRKLVLTPREREIFQLVSQGRTVDAIAAELFLAPATVRTHVRNGIRRVGAVNKVHAISLAVKRREIVP
jgi:DNA-binding CsgD family transcriptional regulator